MASAPADKFAVNFGRSARTLEYEDSLGKITLTFDLGSKGAKSLCLEHCPPIYAATAGI
jgi:hypothetical protein